MNYPSTTLDNGLRVVFLPQEGEVVYCGYCIAVGSGDEHTDEYGLAHFCEHMTFKGTRRHTASQIINAIEGVGGEMNAFTTKETTTYYAVVTRNHFRDAARLLTEMVYDSQCPEAELHREAEVVCNEIEEYEDAPAELIFDDFENVVFAQLPQGHNILGSAERVRTFTRDDVMRFTRKHYRTDNSVFFVSGAAEWWKKEKRRWTAELLRLLPMGNAASADDTTVENMPTEAHRETANPIVFNRDTHQAHVMMGVKTFGHADSRRWTLLLLNNILSGPALNSRLNMALRERRGLVYAVDGTVVTYVERGLWAVYFGCDHSDVARCRRLVLAELQRMARHPMSDRALRRAKEQLYGQMAIAGTHREQQSLDFARSMLLYNEAFSTDDIRRKIEPVTADDIVLMAQELFAQERIVTIIYQ